MAYAPIALTIPQYENYPNNWLKSYEQGTTTPLSMATDVTGGTTLVKCELDAQGFPITAGNARFTPFINGNYDLWLFPTSTEADANDTTNAIQFANNLNADATTKYWYATKALAAAVNFTSSDAGNKIFITSDDGGEFTVRYNATPGTYADDAGTYCGTEFIPSGGDGTIGLVRDFDGGANIKWFGVKGDDDGTGTSGTDDTATIQTAFDYIFNVANSGVGKKLTIPPGYYRTTDEITIIGLTSGAKIECQGFVRFLWDGTTDVTKAMLRFTATAGSTSVDSFSLLNLNLYAADKAGYCVLLEGAAGPTNSVKNNYFRGGTWESATKANLLVGQITEPATQDIDANNNLFDHVTFYNAPYNVFLNGINVYKVFFRDCVFGSNVQDKVIQHARLIVTGNVCFPGSEFGPLNYYDPTNVCCVYTETGGVSMTDIYTEECRLYKGNADSGRFQNSVVLENIYVNDTRLSVTGVSPAGTVTFSTPVYAIESTGQDIKLSHIMLRAKNGSTELPRKIKITQGATIEKVNIGAEGYYELTEPEQCVVDGVRPGAFKAINKNWNFERWTSTNCLEYDNVTGSGATVAFARDATNAVFGQYTYSADVTVAASSGITGPRFYIPNNNARNISVIVSGKTDGVIAASNLSISINSGTGQNGGTNVIAKSDDTFILWAEADLSGQAGVVTTVQIGLNSSNTGKIYYDTAVGISGYLSYGNHSALVSASPDPVEPAEYIGLEAPTVGTWRQGDRVWKISVAAGGSPGWICTTSGTPGTWKAMANVAA